MACTFIAFCVSMLYKARLLREGGIDQVSGGMIRGYPQVTVLPFMVLPQPWRTLATSWDYIPRRLMHMMTLFFNTADDDHDHGVNDLIINHSIF